MAVKISINDFDKYNYNKNLAETYLETNWGTISDVDKETWATNSRFNTPLVTKDPDGYFMFLHYFMSAFGTATNSNSSFFATTALSAGTGNDFANRASRIPWVTT